MIRVEKTAFHTFKKDLDRLFQCNRESARTWNDCLDAAKKHHQANGKWISRSELQAVTKGRYDLHSQSIQSVQERYIQARENAWKAKQAGYGQIRYPYRTKRYYPTRWKKDGFVVYKSGRIELSMGIRNGRREKPIEVNTNRLPEGKIKEIELIWDRMLMLAISYEDGQAPKENSNTGIAAIDMGEIHAIAAISDTGQKMVITARKLRSLKRLRNKKHGQLRKKLSRCKKGSRRWRKLTRAMSKNSSKTDAQQRDILHKTSRQFTRWAAENKVKEVVVGDVEGIQRNTSSRKKTNSKKKRLTRQHNQRMSQWPFGILIAFLTYKLMAEGISLTKIDESYTTQTCPVCGRRKKVSGRIYKCCCGYIEHRDINGAKNILSKYRYKKICDLGFTGKKVTYLRPTG